MRQVNTAKFKIDANRPTLNWRPDMQRVIRAATMPAIALLAIALPTFMMAGAASAQRLVATVNSAPITNYDIKQRIRLLRALRMKSNANSALESLIEDQLKIAEAKKYAVNPSLQQVMQHVARDAKRRKIPAQRLSYSLQRGGIDRIHWQTHYRAQLSWDSLIAGLYRTVGVSVREINNEMARQGKKTNKTEYHVRQVVLVIPRGAGRGAYGRRIREANSLRARFTSCKTGVKLARSLRDIAVKGMVTQRAARLNPVLAKMLAQTPVGRLTKPSRGINGITMVAVCAKRDISGFVNSGGSIGQEIREKKLKVHSTRRYNELRKRAVIIRR